MALRTPLYHRHLALGARMVEFGGYDMPLQYSGIREEHLAVRHRAGLFDISHMGEVRFGGADAEANVQQLVTNDISRLDAAQALYSVMCNDDGGIVDDVVVARGLDGKHIIVTVNAATRSKDVAWMRDRVFGDANITDLSDEIALLAVQGPRAIDIVAQLTDADLDRLAPFHITGAMIAGIDDSRVSVISRTGYTGEDGVEISIDAGRAERLWDALLEAGAALGMVPAGLGARDTLRLEAGLRLYGQDMDETVDPYSAGLGWTVKLDKGDFIGGDALRRIKEAGPARTTIGLRLEGRNIARHGHDVLADGRRIGSVLSGTFSFTLGSGIAIALVDREAITGRTSVDVDIRGNTAPAVIVPTKFYRRATT
ncbi:MAG TPA: glycine cleavage system aminomethyltransferase GcvT [Candidatus Dormibacteraeota bacterium]|jgi:aminomethyltransferase|nr:glycine cleavage system aminomethyltransferase GcvT [Candidatus Dormibacteraeota bacterium]